MPVHPTQIYEIVYNLIVFAILLRLRRRFRPDGSIFLIYLTLYSLWRFGIDFIREGTPFLFIENDYEWSGPEQLRTRVQAFVELLGQGGE